MSKPKWIEVTEGGAGWFAVIMWWNPDMGGFPEPWDTGVGRYPDEAGAIAEAKELSDSEGLELRLTPTP